jgi:hypothetical protein
MTFDERVRALEPLGFSERQTRFLVTVALHGGFCLRRHYTAFAGLKYGAGVRDFLDRLVVLKLARRLEFRRDRGHVYHLHGCGVYDAIGQSDNRNRRQTSAALIARKLMVLDYVLSLPSADWYATEQDKVEFFTQRFGVPLIDLPQRVYVARRRDTVPTFRYFVHKLPIFVTAEPPVPTFVFLVTEVTGQAFDQFLNDHVRLWARLSGWRMVALAPRHIPGLPACVSTFRQFVTSVSRPRPLEETDQLQAYYNTLDLVERNDLKRVTVEELNRFRDFRRRFAAAEYETLFQRWKVEGPVALTDRGARGFLSALDERRGELVTHQLPIRYDRFGTRAGVS